MKIALLALLLAAAPTLAQHTHSVAPAASQPFTAAQMMMTEEEHANMHKIPDGTGLSADGSGFLRAPIGGTYTFIGGRLAEFPGPVAVLDRPTRVYRVLAGSNGMQWILPGTTKPITVPKAFLYPSMRH